MPRRKVNRTLIAQRERVFRRATMFTAAILITLSACNPQKPAGGREPKLLAMVSIQPEATFVKRIGAERLRVETLVTAAQDPHTFEPTPSQLADLSQADVYFRIGLPFEEALMPRLRDIHKDMPIVDISEGIPRRTIEAHDHEEGDADQHEEEGLDPHIWMSPPLVKLMSRRIRDVLIDLDPTGKAGYEANSLSFEAELDRLHEDLARTLAPVKGKPIFVFHPAFGYFADAYGLKQEAVETGGKEPSAKQMAALIDRAREEGVRVIFVQPQFSTAGAQTIAEAIKGAVVPFDALASDYIGNLEKMGRQVQEALIEPR